MEKPRTFYDNKEREIVTYDPEVEGSAALAYDRLTLAREGKMISRGRFLRAMQFLESEGFERPADNRRLTRSDENIVRKCQEIARRQRDANGDIREKPKIYTDSEYKTGWAA